MPRFGLVTPSRPAPRPLAGVANYGSCGCECGAFVLIVNCMEPDTSVRSPSTVSTFGYAGEPGYSDGDDVGPADVDETLTPVLGLVTCQGDRSLFEEFIHARLHCRGALGGPEPSPDDRERYRR